MIEPIAERHLAAIEPDGAGEMMATYCEPVSVLALGSVMGLGDADADTLRRWFGALALGGSNFESDPDKQAIADAASAEVDDRVLPLLDRLEQEPDGSVLSDMLHTQPPDGERLSKAEVLANLKLILLGGMQEPGHALGIALWALLQHPEALAELRAHPELLERRGRGGASLALAGGHPDAPGDRAHRGRGRDAGAGHRDRRCAGVGQPGRAPLAAAGAVRHPPHAARTRRSAWARTTAPARRWPAMRCGCRCGCCWSGCRACVWMRSTRWSCRAGSSGRRWRCTRDGTEVTHG